MERLDFLLRSQNADGGWGYFPGKQSWLEPTVYAALALVREPAAIQKAWNRVRSWQNPGGGFRPCSAVPDSTWVTALAVTFAEVLGRRGPEVNAAIHWLLASTGVESSPLKRIFSSLGIVDAGRDVRYPGWAWRPGSSAWVEPTAHTLVALKKVAARSPAQALSNRIDLGERMLHCVRAGDGGWNYGSPRVLGVELPSYAETTAIALVGLGDRAPKDALDLARRLTLEQTSPLARAWLRVALRGPCCNTGPDHDDVLLCALEALDPELLRPGVRL